MCCYCSNSWFQGKSILHSARNDGWHQLSCNTLKVSEKKIFEQEECCGNFSERMVTCMLVSPVPQQMISGSSCLALRSYCQIRYVNLLRHIGTSQFFTFLSVFSLSTLYLCLRNSHKTNIGRAVCLNPAGVTCKIELCYQVLNRWVQGRKSHMPRKTKTENKDQQIYPGINGNSV